MDFNKMEDFNMEFDCKNIITAIEVSVDPNSPHIDRMEAYHFLENLKTDIGILVKYGMQLCRTEYCTSVRHFGLQMIEDSIRFHWNSLQAEKKVYIKDRVMNLIRYGTLGVLTENMHIKDQVSRLMVEMVKREWPQNWGSLLSDLYILSERGSKQTELVLLILLRLSEDVATLRNFQNSRRQDVYKGLNHVTGSIFDFYFALLEKHYSHYLNNPEHSNEHKEHRRIIQLIFTTLASYMEWVSVKLIFSQDKFFEAMAALIGDPNLSIQVTECLKQIIFRRDRMDDKIPAQLLFDKKLFQPILSAADQLSAMPGIEHNYTIVKGLAQIISSIGVQLAWVWGKEGMNQNEPPTFDTYISVLLAFSSHPSLLIYSYTKDAWKSLFKNEMAKKTDTLLRVLPEWMPIVFKKIIKSGYPSHTDDDSSIYSRLDFDSDSECHSFFTTVKADTVDCLRFAVPLRPDVYFDLVRQGIEQLVIKPVLTPEVPLTEEELEFGSDLANEWVAVASVTETLMPSVCNSKKYDAPITEGVQLLEAVCRYQSTNPVIALSAVESVFGLACFLPNATHLIEPVLSKVLEAIVFKGEPESKSHSVYRAKKNLHRISAMLLRKMVRNHAMLIIVNDYDFIESAITRIVSDDSYEVSSIESTILIQSRLYLTKCQRNVQTFDAMMEKSLLPVRQNWIDLRPTVSTPESLLAYIGVGNEDSSLLETYACNRRFITHCISLTLAVLKSIDPSEEVEDAPPEFVEETRRIVFRHLNPMFVTLYTYCRSHHGMWSSEVQSKLSPVGRAALELSAKEVDSLFLLPETSPTKFKLNYDSIEKIKTFLFSSHDKLCVVLGTAGMYCCTEYYSMPNIVEYCILAPLYNLKNLPDTRVRHVLRSFTKKFCTTCPPEHYNSVLMPILNHLCPIMLDILTDRWQLIAEMEAKSQPEEEDRTAMARDMLIRCTARDYIEFLRLLLMTDPQRDAQESNGAALDVDMDMDTTQQGDLTDSTNVKLSAVGKLMLSFDCICHPVVSSLLLSVSCRDSVCVRKTAQLLLVCIEAMVEDYQQYLSDEAANLFMTTVLRSIHINGEHDADKAILLEIGTKMYVLLRPKFKVVREVMEGFGGSAALDRLDSLVLEPAKHIANTRQAKLPKARKESFQTVIKDIIGKNIGEQFKKEVHIKDLPPMFFTKARSAPVRLDEMSSDLSLCALFDCTET